MEQAEEFTNQFSVDNHDAAHLIKVKDLFRKGRRIVWISLLAFYICIVIASFSGLDPQDQAVEYVFVAVFAYFALLAVALLILHLDARGYELTNEELVGHEFAQAVKEYKSDPPNYDKWKDHMSNAKLLIANHGANIFSKFRSRKVVSYVNRIEDTDADDPSKAYFERFYTDILLDLLDERNGEINDVIESLETSDEGQEDRYWGMITIWYSLENLLGRWRVRSLAPILISLIAGLSIYFLYDEQLGSFITVALLTAIGIVRSRSE